MAQVPHRIDLINYQGVLLTEDTAQAVEEAKAQAAAEDWNLQIIGPRQIQDPRNQLSLIPAGREISLTLRKEGKSELEALTALWNILLPLGFHPMQRFPEIHNPDLGFQWIFYFFGPWENLYQKLMANEDVTYVEVWSSICSAAQIDVGKWRGHNMSERIVQTQLQLIGDDIGPNDGIMGPLTTQAIENRGMGHLNIADLVTEIKNLKPSAPAPEKKTRKKKAADKS